MGHIYALVRLGTQHHLKHPALGHGDTFLYHQMFGRLRQKNQSINKRDKSMYVGYIERPVLKIKQNFYFLGLRVPREKPSLKTRIVELFGINTRLYGRQNKTERSQIYTASWIHNSQRLTDHCRLWFLGASSDLLHKQAPVQSVYRHQPKVQTSRCRTASAQKPTTSLFLLEFQKLGAGIRGRAPFLPKQPKHEGRLRCDFIIANPTVCHR